MMSTRRIRFRIKCIFFCIGLLWVQWASRLNGLEALQYTLHKGKTELRTEWGSLVAVERIGTMERWIFDTPDKTTVVYLSLEKAQDTQYTMTYDLKILEIVELQKRSDQIKLKEKSILPTPSITPLNMEKTRKTIETRPPLLNL